MSRNLKNLLNQIGWFFSSQLIVVLTPLISIPIIIRLLGIEVYGEYSILMAKGALITIVGNYGFDISSVHWIRREYLIKKLFINIQAIKIVIVMISASAYIFIKSILSGMSSNDVLLLLFCFFQVIFPNWFYLSKREARSIAIFSYTNKLLFLILISLLYFLKGSADITCIIGAALFPFLLTTCISNFIECKRLRVNLTYLDFRFSKILLKDSLHFFMSRVSIISYSNLNVIVLSFFVSNISVGWYSIAEKLYQAIQLLYRPLVNAIYPFFSRGIDFKMYWYLFLSLNFINILGVIFCYSFANEIIYFLSSEYNDSVKEVFRILLISIVFLLPSILLGHPLLGNLKYSLFVNKSIMNCALMHIVIMSVMSLFGFVNIYSVASMVVFTEGCILMLRVIKVRKVLNENIVSNNA